MLQSDQGRTKLRQDLNICKHGDLTSDNDKLNFFTNLAGNIDGVVQYNKDNNHFGRAAEEASVPTIDSVCAIMVDGQQPYDAYVAAQKYLMGSECLEISYSDMIAEMRNTSLDSDVAGGMRQWVYQTCVEFGYYQTSEDKNALPFADTIPLSFSLQQCQDIYGLPPPNVGWTNAYYGGCAQPKRCVLACVYVFVCMYVCV